MVGGSLLEVSTGVAMAFVCSVSVGLKPSAWCATMHRRGREMAWASVSHSL